MSWLQDGTPKNVIIIGGSVCGLMHGIMIKRLGHNVHIMEQTNSSYREGLAAGISLGPHAREFFSRYDRSHQTYYLDDAGVQFINKDGTHGRFFNNPFYMTSWNVLYYKLRANFDGSTSKFCTEPLPVGKEEGRGSYDLGKRVKGVEYTDGQMVVTYTDLANGEESSLRGDLVIAADGSSSTIRQLVLPGSQRLYSGYVGWRGTVPEHSVSPETVKLLDGNFCVYQMPRSYFVSYIIPGDNGTLEPGQRVLNYLWYYNVPETSPSFADMMTDTDGHTHRHTLPSGKMRPSVWSAQLAHGDAILPPPYKELMHKTLHPFISAIRDTPSSRASFFDGRLLLVGEALALFRPHIGASTNQAALNCLALEKVFRGEIGVGEWESEVLEYAKRTRLLSNVVGNFFQAGWGAFLGTVALYCWVLLVARVRGLFR